MGQTMRQHCGQRTLARWATIPVAIRTSTLTVITPSPYQLLVFVRSSSTSHRTIRIPSLKTHVLLTLVSRVTSSIPLDSASNPLVMQNGQTVAGIRKPRQQLCEHGIHCDEKAFQKCL